MQTLRKALAFTFAASALVACVPDVEDTDAVVDAPRVLAIRASPAEAYPTDTVSYQALYADASGTLTAGPLDWAFCLERKSLAELGPVNPNCLVPEGDGLSPIGAGLKPAGDIPEETCRLFGPDSPPADDEGPGGRPVDPDVSGGFYQPVRVLDPDTQRYTIYESRVQCGLPSATQAQSADYTLRYKPNANPAIASFEAVHGKVSDALAPAAKSGGGYAVKRGERLTLRVQWAQCPAGNECGDGVCGIEESAESCDEDCAAPTLCTGSEHYLYFDPVARELVARRESIRVSWFSTAGSFRDARTGRAAIEARQSLSDNVWTAPDEAGDVTVWVVLRDDRGGTAWQSYVLHVGR